MRKKITRKAARAATRGPPMRVFIACCALLFAGCAYAQSEPPKGFLHCIGQAAGNKTTEHTIALYSKTAVMDSQKYALYSDDAHYALQADEPSFDMPPGIVIVTINRVTGSYEISDGPNLVQRAKTETGTCTKLDRQF